MKLAMKGDETKTIEIVKRKFSQKFFKKVSLEELNFLHQLPVHIREILLEKFQRSADEEIVKEYFREHSFLSRVLMENPATFKMLELIYTGENVQGLIDKYSFNSPSAQGLRNRLSSVINNARTMIKMKVSKGIGMKVFNFGSGPGRDTIEILEGNSYLTSCVSISCVDIDYEALKKGKEIMKEKNLTGINFIQKDLVRLSCRKEIDLGLMIGVLCGLESRTCIAVLKRIKRYFKEGAILIASNVLENMYKEDPFMSYLLKEVIGWKLVFKTPERLRQIFEEAGYEWEGVFYDEPTRYHALAVGKVPLT